MKKYLLIVESPTKARTLSQYLGKDYIILATVGHIKMLSKKNAVNTNTFEVVYEDIARAKKNIVKIIDAAKTISHNIYIATDPDREGEAIAYQIYEELSKNKITKPINRVVFYEVTKKVVIEAINNPSNINMALVDAQKVRSILDYLVGFTLSPLLWIKMPGCKSAGRVQSWMLKFICEREKQIISFKSTEYWNVFGNFQYDPVDNENVMNWIYKKDVQDNALSFDQNNIDKGLVVSSDTKNKADALQVDNKNKILNGIKLYSIDNKRVDKMHFKSEQDIKEQLIIDNNKFCIEDIITSRKSRNPAAPFITSTLQQAGYRIGFSAKKVMVVAQKLYEDGLITYMRTDSTVISAEKLDDIRKLIISRFGDQYALTSHRVYKKKSKNSQEAHEAIRPTNIFVTPDKLDLEADNLKLYTMIWQYTIASQMKQAIYENMQVFISNNHVQFVLSGSRLVFDGFYVLLKTQKQDDLLPNFVKGQVLYLSQLNAKQNFTLPPDRFSEGAIIKNMEELGIGRPSTYATILGILKDRKYVNISHGSIRPERNGQILSEFLKHYFVKYVDDGFTASMEENLDKVALGELVWKDVLEDFWKHFIDNIQSVKSCDTIAVVRKVEELSRYFLPVGIECKKCNKGKLELRWGRFSLFIACNRYPDCDACDSINTTGEIKADKIIGKFLGNDIFVKMGRFGEYIESVDAKGNVIRCSIKKFSSDLNEATACKLLEMPKKLGEIQGESVLLAVGMYGVYVKVGDKNYRLPKDKDWRTVDYKYVSDVLIKTMKFSKSKTVANKAKSDVKSAQSKVVADRVLVKSANKTAKVKSVAKTMKTDSEIERSI
ncbi:MAG: type I DNA topoisomerase [Pseudomonadota bacterium]